MPDLSTQYMGMSLKNPLVVAACSLSARVDRIRKIEQAGAGALVIKSLFEEQILHERGELEQALDTGAESFAEALSYFPQIEHSGAREHLMWVEKARQAVEMPLIASLNAVNPGSWVDYARQLAGTGVDGLELNVYAVEADPARGAAEIEERMLSTFAAVREAVDLPIAVKLGPYYTSVAHVVTALEQAGAGAVVLFNRFLQPDIDLDNETVKSSMTPSTAQEMRLPLRWIALLYGRVGLDLAGNTGVREAGDLAKFLLAGAGAVQVASLLLQKGLDHISVLLSELEQWMAGKGYEDLAAFRGKLSQREHRGNPAVLERAHYVDFLMGRQKWG